MGFSALSMNRTIHWRTQMARTSHEHSRLKWLGSQEAELMDDHASRAL